MNVINPASENHRKQMETLGNFMGADKIEYVDKSDNEVYVIDKGGKRLKLKACYNRADGAFLAVE
jgi:hypothetical protein